MFQFPEFPTHTYVFSIRFIPLRYECFHIRKSTGRSLFAAHRSLSQLIASFIGSWCQGIHLMLFFAWTISSNIAVSRSLELLEFLEHFIFRFVNSLWKGFILLCFESFFHLSVKLYFTQIGKTYNSYFANLVKNICPLICSFLTLQYTLFGFQWT